MTIPDPRVSAAAPPDPQVVQHLLDAPMSLIFRRLDELGQPMIRASGIMIADHRAEALRAARGAEYQAWDRYLRDAVAVANFEQARRDTIGAIIRRSWDPARSPGARLAEMIAALPLRDRQAIDEAVAEEYQGRRPSLTGG